ncbi:hypothetical protein NI26_12335 [Curtobacterium sp. MR_MD2014]|nr:hypothetical protein NI26_12335 [Curtobacterium sp. MR_MD2014]
MSVRRGRWSPGRYPAGAIVPRQAAAATGSCVVRTVHHRRARAPTGARAEALTEAPTEAPAGALTGR